MIVPQTPPWLLFVEFVLLDVRYPLQVRFEFHTSRALRVSLFEE
jgi:hypothetical protein